MAQRFLVFLFIIFFIGCSKNADEPVEKKVHASNDIEFDKSKWIVKEGLDYPYRDRMIPDLITENSLKEFKKLNEEQVIEKLGQPDRQENNHLYYLVRQKRLGGFFPLNSKFLVIKIKEEGTVEWVKIHQ